MKALPYDRFRCVPESPCPDREHCARYTSPHNPHGWQPVMDASALRLPDHCVMYIDNREDNQ